MHCKKIHKLIPDFLCEALPPEDAEEVRRHIESCPACRAEVRVCEATWKTAGEIRDVKPRPGFTRSVRQRLEREPRPIRRRTGASRGVSIKIALTAAACILVAIGLFFFMRRPEPSVGPRSGLTEKEEVEIIRNLDLLVNLDSLSDERLETGDIDILKGDDYVETEELSRINIDIKAITFSTTNGQNGTR